MNETTKLLNEFQGRVELEKKLKTFSFKAFVEEIGDVEQYLNNDVAIKFWIPEVVEVGIEELAEMDGESLSNMVRNFLLMHCYGVYAFKVIMQKRVAADSLLHDIRFSRKANPEPSDPTYWVALLGKNIAPIKLWIPSVLKNDLQTLADLAGLKLSQYIREIVISRLLGHGMLPIRPEMMKVEPTDDLERWLADEEVEWHQVSRDEYLKHPVGEIRWDYKD